MYKIRSNLLSKVCNYVIHNLIALSYKNNRIPNKLNKTNCLKKPLVKQKRVHNYIT